MQSVTDLFCKANQEPSYKIEKQRKDFFREKTIKERLENSDVKNPSKARILLNEYVLKHKLKNKDCCKKMSMTRESTFASWLRGDTKPNKDYRKKIEQVFNIKKEFWNDKFEKENLENLGLRFLKMSMKEKDYGFTRLAQILNINKETIRKWFKEKKSPNSQIKQTIFDFSGIHKSLWDKEVSDKEWEEIIKNENNIPWKKNSKIVLRKKQQDSSIEIMNDIDKKLIDEISVDWINNFLWKENRNDDITCLNCDVAEMFGTTKCYEYMEKLTGIDCADENIIFRVKKHFKQCTKENTNYGDIVYLDKEKFKIIGFVKAENTKFESSFVLENIDSKHQFIDKMENYLKRIN